jgi:hypothetical protein
MSPRDFIKVEEIEDRIYYSADRALYGVVGPNVRLITIGWKDFEKIFFRVYFSNEPSEQEKEDLDAAYGEILADFPFKWGEDIEHIVSDKPPDQLEILKVVVYPENMRPVISV